MRALIAERMNLDPRARRRPAHLLPVRAAAHDADAPVPGAGSGRAAIVALPVAAGRHRRVLSRSCALARRLAPPRFAPLAALALAVSPLHIQASITAVQRSAVLACCGAVPGASARGARLRSRARPSRSPACSRRWPRSRATTPGSPSRSSSLAAWSWSRARPARGRLARPGGLRGCAPRRCRSPGSPGARGRPTIRFFFAHYITNDHAQLAAAMTARLGRAGRAAAPGGDLDAGVRRAR